MSGIGEVRVFGNQAEGVALAEFFDGWQEAGDPRLWKNDHTAPNSANQLTRGLRSMMEKNRGAWLEWVAVTFQS